MKITTLISLAAAVFVVAEASPLKVHPKHGHAVPLKRNPNYKHNTKAQIAKMNSRYGNKTGNRVLDGSTGTVGLMNVQHDLEYYGSVSVGSPAQVFKLDFDTVCTPWTADVMTANIPFLCAITHQNSFFS